MREWVLSSVVVVALASSCVVPVEDVEKTQAGGAAGAGSMGGSATGGNGGSGGAGNGGTAGNGGSSNGGGSAGSAGSAIGGSGGSAGTANGGTGGTGSAGAGGGGGGTGGATQSCPTEGGAMVLVPDVAGGHTCVDATEVTQSAYQAFLATNPDSLTQPAGCTGQSFTPSASCNGYSPVAYPNRPSVCVDWCDARGFCQYVGKHLCGKVGGGPVNLGEGNDPGANEWYNACSAGGTQNFPYGNLYVGSTCNGLNAGTLGPMNVTFFAACVGGYPGLYDMSGNVREWTQSCSGDLCMVRGGSWLDAATGTFGLGCTSTGTMGRKEVNDRLGFRCCATPL